MKFESEKIKIEAFVQKVSRITGKHLTLPVLSCILLEVLADGKLILRSTNLDIGIEMELKVKSQKPGSIAVPASVLLGAISSVKDKDLIFEMVENNLKISSTNNSILIKSVPHEDFPSIPKIENGEKIQSVKIGSKELLLGFKSVFYSASNSNIKPELGSVLIKNFENGLVFAATDSFRLAEKKINTKIASDFPQVLIPNKNVIEIMKLFEDYDGEITVLFDKNQAALVVPGLYIVSRLVDGAFPDYRQIIPKNFESSATVLKNDLSSSIKSSNVFSDSLNQVKLRVDTKNKALEVQSRNNDVGEYKESIKAVVDGDNIELNFNSRYVSDCLQSIPGESIILSFGGAGKPLAITGSSDKSFLYIVMPMNR